MTTALERNLGKDAPLGRKTRIGGAILLAAGLFLLKVGVLDTLKEARAHEAHALSVSSGVAIAPAAVILGALMLVGGARVVGWGKRFGLERRPDGTRPAALYVVALVLGLPGFALLHWLNVTLGDLGYGAR